MLMAAPGTDHSDQSRSACMQMVIVIDAMTWLMLIAHAHGHPSY
jgi:hypothetical protein